MAIRTRKFIYLDYNPVAEFWVDSELVNEPGKQVQDPYSFRCMPQVHGASKDTLRYVTSVLETELNSVTDNPNIFPESDEIISAGNFDLSNNLRINTDKFIVDNLGNIKSSGNFDLSNNFRINTDKFSGIRFIFLILNDFYPL
jgi:histidine ammonia-lyase